MRQRPHRSRGNDRPGRAAATILVGSILFFGGNALVASFGWDHGFFIKKLGKYLFVIAIVLTWQFTYHVMAQRRQEH